MTYPCSVLKFDIKFGNRLYSKGKRRAPCLFPFEYNLLPKLISNFYHYNQIGIRQKLSPAEWSLCSTLSLILGFKVCQCKIRHPVDAYQAQQNSRQKQNQYSGINKETGIEDKTVLEEEVGKTFFSPSSQDFVVSKENNKIEWQENDIINYKSISADMVKLTKVKKNVGRNGSTIEISC